MNREYTYALNAASAYVCQILIVMLCVNMSHFPNHTPELDHSHILYIPLYITQNEYQIFEYACDNVLNLCINNDYPLKCLYTYRIRSAFSEMAYLDVQ